MKTALKINDIPVEIPVSWDELTFGQFLSISKAETDAEILSGVTGIELQLCDQVNPELLSILLHPLIELMHEQPPMTEPTFICGEPFPEKIGRKEFARKVNCDAAMNKLKGMELIGRMVSIYLATGIQDEDIQNFEKKVLCENFICVFSAGQKLIEQLNKLNESEKKIPSPNYRSEEIRAGINDFKKYGVMSLVRGIALKWGISKDDVFKWSYNEVLLELKISADENSYQRKLSEILNPKK